MKKQNEEQAESTTNHRRPHATCSGSAFVTAGPLTKRHTHSGPSIVFIYMFSLHRDVTLTSSRNHKRGTAMLFLEYGTPTLAHDTLIENYFEEKEDDKTTFIRVVVDHIPTGNR